MRRHLRLYLTAARFDLVEHARNRLAMVLVALFIPAWISLAYAVIPSRPVAFRLRATGRLLEPAGDQITQITGAINAVTLITGFGDLTCGVPTVLNVMQAKTAALTGAACQAGAILAGATPQQHQALRQYGEQLGMAFQIRDDLLPYTAEEQVTGKTATSDVANLQPTLPVLLAYEAADEADRNRMTTVFRGGTDPVTAHRDILAVLTRTGALNKAAHMASSCAEQAHAELTGLPDSTQLAKLATSAADRQR